MTKTFKDFLTEAKIDFAPWQFKTADELSEFWNKNNRNPRTRYMYIYDFKWNKNGTVTPIKTSGYSFNNNNYVETTDGGLGLPVVINSGGKRPFRFSGDITNLQGFPLSTSGIDLIIAAPKLENLNFVKANVSTAFINTPSITEWGDCKIEGKKLIFHDTGNIPYKGLEKHFPTITISINFSKKEIPKLEKGILAFFKIPTKPKLFGIKNNTVGSHIPSNDPVLEAMTLYNLNVKEMTSLFDMQDLLIKNGFKKYARL